MNIFMKNILFNKKIYITITLLLLALLIFISFPAGDAVRVKINPGMSARAVAAELKEKGVIRNTTLFLRFINLAGMDRNIKSGTYFIRPGLNYYSIMRKLGRGDEHLVSVTIPEGFRAEQIAARLYRRGIISDTGEFMEIIEERELRGFLFPETYFFPENSPPEKIINAMVAQFNRVFTPDWEERARELGYSLKEIVTLASIIEKEARLPEERPIISDVFHKRLSMRMYLESCASIQFALGETRPRLTYRDLEVESPYNTYRNFGLPPTPIASPGRESLEAALFPEDTDYLFFFTVGEGRHIFSSTYEQHLRRQRRAGAY